MTIRELYAALDARIPRSLSCDWDNDGLAVCPDPNTPVTGVLVALDPTEDAVNAAREKGYNVLLTHHPLLFRGVKEVSGGSTVSRKVIALLTSGVSAMAFHTRLDTVDGGVNDTLAVCLGLTDVSSFGDDNNAAGKAMGRIGSLPTPMSMADFAALVKERLNTPAVTYADSGKVISRVAVLGGGGDEDAGEALLAGADVYVTGELKYHQLCDIPYEGMSLVAAGHFHTEFPVCATLCDMVKGIFAEAGDHQIPVDIYKNSRVTVG